jgi:predicted nucleic acid-binding protein
MRKNIAISSLLFVDTWGWCASVNPKDKQYHKIKQIIEKSYESGNHLITTNFVLDEAYTLIRLRVNHRASVNLHQTIAQLVVDDFLDIIHITPEIEQSAWRIFERYLDKDFSFTDCTSFVIMQLLEIRYALTEDDHFKQIGFQMLP